MPTLTSIRLWSIVTQKRESKNSRKLWLRRTLLFQACMEKWNSNKEILSWSNLDKAPWEYSLPQTCLLEVSMSSKSVSLSTTNFLSVRRTIFIELEEPVGLEEKEPQSTSCCQEKPASLRSFKIITTLKSRRCQQTLTSCEPSSLSEAGCNTICSE